MIFQKSNHIIMINPMQRHKFAAPGWFGHIVTPHPITRSVSHIMQRHNL